jgi:hypothetical protein
MSNPWYVKNIFYGMLQLIDRPPLPPLPLAAQSMRGPTDCSNWAVKDVILCGEYPGNKNDATHMANLMAYCQAGMTILSACKMQITHN